MVTLSLGLYRQPQFPSRTLLWRSKSTTSSHLIHTPKQPVRKAEPEIQFPRLAQNSASGTSAWKAQAQVFWFQVFWSKVIALPWKVRSDACVGSYETLGFLSSRTCKKWDWKLCVNFAILLKHWYFTPHPPHPAKKKVKLILEEGSLFGHALILKMCLNYL